MEQQQTTALAERMLEEGRISPALANAALERHKNLGERFEEAPETAIRMSFLASRFKMPLRPAGL